MSMDFIDLPDPTFCYFLTVPLGDKQWITANQRLFWRVRSTRTKQWRAETQRRARIAGIPRLEHAWIVAELSFCDTRRRDPSNWAPTAKACVDGLVDAGIFTDDDAKHVIGPDMRLADKSARGGAHLRLLLYPTEGVHSWSK